MPYGFSLLSTQWDHRLALPLNFGTAFRALTGRSLLADPSIFIMSR
jgi:hypothetical protein